MNDYMKSRYLKRRLNAIEKLGGCCKICGEDDYTLLEFDHIDPKTKEFTIAKASSFSEERFNKELDKCQLLCKTCHKIKSSREFENKQNYHVCVCGKEFFTDKSYAGHKRWCNDKMRV